MPSPDRNAQSEWIDGICTQIAFETMGPERTRSDPYVDWDYLVAHHPQVVRQPASGEPFSEVWLREHSGLLWLARELIDDRVSKLLFDAYLVLRAVGPFRFRFPRIDFDGWLKVQSRHRFSASDLPGDWIGLPLEVFEVQVQGASAPVRVIATDMQISLCNAFRQYAPTRGGMTIGPRTGDVVLDCGACIGDFSTIFAAMTGPGGAVHMIDPVPLHLKYCALQASLNPPLAHVLQPVCAAVGSSSGRAIGTTADLPRISPGGLKVTAYEMVSLDDYVIRAALDRVDFVKMDIEGAELDAITGASRMITQLRPRLAISAYHRPSDLWQIPQAIRRLNPGYRLHFGHHSPIRWESVYYAVPQDVK